MRRAFLGATLLLVGCSRQAYVLVSVEATAGLPPIVQLRSTADDGSSQSVATVPAVPVSGGIAFPRSFTVALPSGVSQLDELVEGLGAGGAVVARGSATASLESSAQSVLVITLTPACATSRDCDPARICAGTQSCSSAGACVSAANPPAMDGTPCGPFAGTCVSGACPLAFCGDGVVQAGEQCDDGAANSDTAPNACRTDCQMAHCGDGVVDQGERCDLGQSVNGTQAGCDASCALLGNVGTLAGTAGGFGYLDASGAQARFGAPEKLETDDRYVYVTERDLPVLRRIDRATRAVETFAGNPNLPGHQDGIGPAARFTTPTAMVRLGNLLYVADDTTELISSVDLTTLQVTTIAGTPNHPDTVDGPFSIASFRAPAGLTSCTGNELFVAERYSCVLRRVDLVAQTVSTVVGAVDQCFVQDGTGTQARMRFPETVACDGNFLYVGCDDSSLRVVDVDAGYQVSSVPLGSVAVSTMYVAAGGGRVYVGDASRNVLWAGAEDGGNPTMSVIAGGTAGFDDDAGVLAEFSGPAGPAVDADAGLLFLADRGNSVIRVMDLATTEVGTFAGAPPQPGIANGVGTAAQFTAPSGIAVQGSALYVVDHGDDLVRAVDLSSATVSSAAGTAYTPVTTDGTGSAAAFALPTGVVAFQGSLVVTEVRKLRTVSLPGFQVTTLTGVNAVGLSYTDGPLDTALFFNPNGITTDGTRLFVADTGNDTIRAVDLTARQVSTLAGHPGLSGVADGQGARFSGPSGVAYVAGALFVADTDNDIIRRVDPTSGITTTFAGLPGVVDFLDGIGAAAAFNTLQGVCSDGKTLFVADTGNNAIREVDPSTARVTTVAGGGQPASVDGSGRTAYFNGPVACAFDPTSGDLLVSDRNENVIRRVH